jgi:hypothetical protein
MVPSRKYSTKFFVEKFIESYFWRPAQPNKAEQIPKEDHNLNRQTGFTLKGESCNKISYLDLV